MIEPMKSVLLRLMLEAIHCDRTGQSLYNEKSSILHGVIQSLVSVEEFKKKNTLELYESIFESAFLASTGEYYRYRTTLAASDLVRVNISGPSSFISVFRQEASRLLQECSISVYMEKVLQRRDEEDLRSRKFLHASSYGRVRSECEQRMVTDHLQAIHNECPKMVQKEVVQDLRNAYALLKVI